MTGDRVESAYRRLVSTGELTERRDAAVAMLAECQLCPRQCHANRLGGEPGFCRSGRQALVASHGPHFGEERPLVGANGSGTIFFANCSLGCIFCQNYDISHLGHGRAVSDARLAELLLDLQSLGCHNINLVTPTHFVPQILEALVVAAQLGLEVPLVYNCGGYESVATLALLDGVVDIYMPDAKYSDSEAAAQLSGAADYPQHMKVAIAEMHRQVGDLQIDERGLARRGLLVRHLVLPENLAGTEEIVRFLANLSPNTYVNVMAQYRPCYRASEVEQINRRPTVAEYRAAVHAALAAGLHRLDERPLRIL